MSELPSYRAKFADGAVAQATAYQGGILKLICKRAHPPGQPLQFVLALPDFVTELQGKSTGSKRREDGAFDVHVKLSSLRRDQREQLVSALTT